MFEWTSFCMFILSFFPLWISIIFINVNSIYDKYDGFSLGFESISILILLLVNGIAFTTFFREIYFGGKDEDVEFYVLDSANEEKKLTSEFLVAYMMPLCAFNFTKWDGVVLFLIYFITLSILCVRHNLFTVNVILEIFGYRFYSCKLRNCDNIQFSKIIISRKNLLALAGTRVKIIDLNNEFILHIDD